MINIKTEKEIEIMARGGKILAEVFDILGEKVDVGWSELEIDALAEKLIREKGAEPGFKMVEGYKHTVCISVNDVVVHGVPTEYKLKRGDIIGIDCGVYFEGFHTDMSNTYRVCNKEKGDEVDKFLETGVKALNEAIAKAKIGNRIGDISKTIQDIVEKQNKYSVVRSLVGHGIGRNLHEEPEVPGYLASKIENTPELVEGMVIAIEVIYNMGKPELVYANDDGWTLKTEDGSLSGLFERTVAITKDGPKVLTE